MQVEQFSLRMEALAKGQSTRELRAPNIVHNEAAES